MRRRQFETTIKKGKNNKKRLFLLVRVVPKCGFISIWCTRIRAYTYMHRHSHRHTRTYACTHRKKCSDDCRCKGFSFPSFRFFFLFGVCVFGSPIKILLTTRDIINIYKCTYAYPLRIQARLMFENPKNEHKSRRFGILFDIFGGMSSVNIISNMFCSQKI